jgi:GNAT superfamily N-acetyltransferase
LTTIYELTQDKIQRAAPLYAGVPFDQPCYDAVFEGKQEGRIFVDDADAPTAALLCRSYEYYPAGAASPQLRAFLRDAPEEAEVFGAFYGYVPVNAAWRDVLLADLPLETIGRVNFQWEAGTPVPDWRAALPDDGRIVAVDGAMAERLDRECYPVPFVLYDWGSYAAYAAHGYGFALMIGEAVASTITAISVSERHALINVATEPPFRRRGFAALVGACFVEETLRRGLLPTWDTDDTNTGSVATARRIGFTEHAPFVELALPERAKPTMTQGVWQRESEDDGVIVWRRED